ncbi:hypothetical protein JXA88_10425 [Candidatus Fermentibacteria bacterium]|nr:hypothetical protein [Candidatus Fermentibacteria bacterium]
MRLTLLFSAVVTLLFLVFSSHAEIPQVISYQGKVTDTAGNPVPDASYSMRFRVYDAESGGTLRWDSNAQTVAVSGGIFNVLLGESPQPAITLDFTTDYWLSVTFSGTTVSPRSRLASVGYAYMASGLVPGTQISGSVTTGSGAVLATVNTATTGTTYGAYGQVSSTEGRGLYGWATATTGLTTGVTGVSSSTAGRGVVGYCTASTGVNYGVYAYSASSTGQAVFGYALNSTGPNYAGYFQTQSPSGTGVYGFADASTGTSFGVYGRTDSDDGFGVIGVHEGYDESDLGTYYAPGGFFGGRNGVIGVTDYPGGYGVMGISTTTWGSYGVYGRISGTSGFAVHADATSSIGTTYAVRAVNSSSAGYGVYGHAEAGSGTTYGVYGKATSTAGYGVYGEGINGVRGTSSAVGGVGVVASASATSGSGNGLSAYTWAPNGTAVRAQVYGEDDHINYGVMGISSSPSGYGVYYIGGIGGSGLMRNMIRTSHGTTALDVMTAAGNWVEDFGAGRLENGRAHVPLDPLFLETVRSDEAHPMKVFVQLSGPCNGVYVEKGTTWFEVVELNGGASSVSFDYRVVAEKRGFEGRRLEILDIPDDEYHINQPPAGD